MSDQRELPGLAPTPAKRERETARRGGPWLPPAKNPCRHRHANGLRCERESQPETGTPGLCAWHLDLPGENDPR